MTTPEIILFTHIQKTAGTTLGRLLKAKYGLWPPSNLMRVNLAMGLHSYHMNGDFPDARIRALQQLQGSEKSKIRLVQGHMGFGVHEYFSQPYQYITALREPVERVLSHFSQLMKQEWFPYKDQIRSMSIEDFMKTYPIDALSNWQTKMISGAFNECPGDLTPYKHTESNEELLSRAIQNLDKYYLVVITERFNESLMLLQQALGWRNAYYIKSNVSKVRTRKVELGKPTLDFIREQNALDMKLYGHAIRRLEEELSKQHSTFDNELAKFEESNRRLNQIFFYPIDKLFAFGRSLNLVLNKTKDSQV